MMIPDTIVLHNIHVLETYYQLEGLKKNPKLAVWHGKTFVVRSYDRDTFLWKLYQFARTLFYVIANFFSEYTHVSTQAKDIKALLNAHNLYPKTKEEAFDRGQLVQALATEIGNLRNTLELMHAKEQELAQQIRERQADLARVRADLRTARGELGRAEGDDTFYDPDN